MSADQAITLESLTHTARKTTEVPARVSVVDVIAVAKGCDIRYAAEMFRRMLRAGNVPEGEEVPQSLVDANCVHQDAPVQHGGNRKPVLVASAQEVVQILWALPGSYDFRRNCADVVVRYLGGAQSLVAEVFRNREAQEQLAAVAPAHPARIFGEAVEAAAAAEDGNLMRA